MRKYKLVEELALKTFVSVVLEGGPSREITRDGPVPRLGDVVAPRVQGDIPSDRILGGGLKSEGLGASSSLPPLEAVCVGNEEGIGRTRRNTWRSDQVGPCVSC